MTVSLSQRLRLNVPREKLWLLLKDTDRLNMSIGLSPVRFRAQPNGQGTGRFRAVTRVLGIPLAYDEYPFEWVEGRYYVVQRKFDEGPISEISAGIRMEVSGAATDLEVFADVEPRSAAGAFVARRLLKRFAVDKVVNYARDFEKKYAASASVPLAMPSARINERQLGERTALLKKEFSNSALIAALLEMLRFGSDIDVTRFRPFALADRWGSDRFETLRLFLHAAKCGLVDLVWDVLCPHCRAEVTKDTNLADLKPELFCSTCDIKVGVDLAESVEVTFKVNSGIRVAYRAAYCIGGPANKPDVAAQWRLAPGASRKEPTAVPITFVRSRCFPASAESGVMVRAADGMIEAFNSGTTEVLLVIEKQAWREAAATAALVTSLQEFRDLFPEEAVAPGSEVAIGRVAVMFTDLQGSTEMYESAGDTKAFDFVLSHFRYLMAVVARHHGGLVKTMGDAIMASFYSGRDAVRAAIEMQREWQAFVRSKEILTKPKLKIGIHQGGAIATNNNGKFDYFGTTVNIAARTEGKSIGGDVVFTEAVGTDPDVKTLLSDEKLAAETFESSLKGISAAQRLFRVIP